MLDQMASHLSCLHFQRYSTVGNAFVTTADQGTSMIVCAGITDQWVCMGNTISALAINYLINEM